MEDCFFNIRLMNKIEQALQKTTDTKACLIGRGVVADTAQVFTKLFPGKKAIIVADTNTWKVAGEAVQQSLDAANVAYDAPYVFNDPHLHAEWKFVEQLQQVLEKTDAIAIAVGAGVINDLTKYVSHILGRQYICVGTACSMDGFTAFGASITKDGNKQTFSCPAPLGFVMDPLIAAEAPKELAASGYADLIAKIPAGADWMLSDTMGGEKIHEFAFSLVQGGLKEALANPAAVFAGDVENTEKLAEGLLMSGFAMQAMQSSRPASGLEHQFSHFWDMEGLSYPNGQHVSHGFKVGIGTLISTLVLEFLLAKDIAAVDTDALVAKWKTWDEMEAEIRALCVNSPIHLSRCLEEAKNKYVDAEGLRQQIELLKAAWPTLSGKIREQIIPFDQLYENLKAVGAPYEPEMICVSREHLKETFSLIPFMRSRISCIDVMYRLGYLEEFKASLFDKGGRWELAK